MISNVFLVLLSIICLIVVISIVILMSPGDPGKEMLDQNIFQVGEIIGGPDAAGNWDALNGRLSAYGYRLLVLEDDTVVFSALSDSQKEILISLKSLKPGQSTLMGKTQDLTFAAVADGSNTIFAVEAKADPDVPGAADVSGGFFKLVLVFFLIPAAVILMFSLLFTRKMAWRILRPLNALSEGAKRIENGDYSGPVIYAGKDEFASVCMAFNHMQEHLLREREKITAYERARTDLIAGISHDLRTPLTSVKGYIKGLRDGVANTPEKREKYLRVAYEKACDMDVLLQKLFYFSNLETGNLPLSLSIEDLGDFSRKFAENIREELDCRNIKLTLNVTSVPHPVKIDVEQMRRVLLNLTENAVRYANTGALALSISVWQERGMEHLLFADNGRGVPEEYLPHLFERFWKNTDLCGTKDGESSGLGLYIVNYIVEAHGGFVTAENNNGLAVEITLPCGVEEKD